MAKDVIATERVIRESFKDAGHGSLELAGFDPSLSKVKAGKQVYIGFHDRNDVLMVRIPDRLPADRTARERFLHNKLADACRRSGVAVPHRSTSDVPRPR